MNRKVFRQRTRQRRLRKRPFRDGGGFVLCYLRLHIAVAGANSFRASKTSLEAVSLNISIHRLSQGRLENLAQLTERSSRKV